ETLGEFVEGLPTEEQGNCRGGCLENEYASIAGVPIRYRDAVVGAIHLADEREGQVSSETVEFLESLAPLIGEAGHRFEVEAELQRRHDTETAVNALLSLALTDTPLREVLQRALDLVTSIPWLTLESTGSMFLFDEDAEELVMEVETGLSDSVKGVCARVPLGRCLCGRAAASQETQFAGCVDHRHDIVYEGMVPHGHYCVPIVFDGRTLGVVNLYVKEGHPRDQMEEAFLTAIASTLAGIISRREADEQHRQLENRYRELVHGVGAIVWEADPRTCQFTFVSKAATDILGYEVEEWLSQPGFWPDHIHPDDRDDIVAFCRQEVMEGRSHEFEYRMIAADGSPVWLRDVVKVESDNGSPVRIRGLMIDITERKRAEAEQIRLRQRLESLWNISKLVDEDQQSLTSHILEEVIRLTDSRYAFHGAPDEGGVAMAAHSLHQEVAEDFATSEIELHLPIAQGGPWADAVRDKRPVIANEYAAAGADGAGFPAGHVQLSRLLVVPVIVEDRVVSLVTAADKATDYTEDDARDVEAFAANIQMILDRRKANEEREETREQLLQAQKMDAVGMLAAGIAHDFNNLLTAIQGYIDLAAMKTDEADLLLSHLRQARSAAERAGGLTRQLLLFGRKQPMELSLLSLNQTAEDMLKMLNRIIGEDIAVATDLDPGLWPVRADASNLEQMIMNLVVNARDAMAEGGSLTVATENLVLDKVSAEFSPGRQPGKYVCLSVTDTGTGMDEETARRVFEPFFTTKEVGKGTGLGLSVVYGIARQHGGWVSVQSEPGNGTQFKVCLPAFTGELSERVEEEVSVGMSRGGGERVLVVEDDDSVRELAAKALTDNGYAVQEADSAEEAMRAFKGDDGAFELLFSDVILPGNRGDELAEELVALKPELQILLTTGYADERSHWSALRERGFPLLRKPYSLNDLILAVQEAARTGSAERQDPDPETTHSA
ncbi:GAF domain-containing protein, partial [bacterium]|nr:GAF domain-containing protein [bacterium]